MSKKKNKGTQSAAPAGTPETVETTAVVEQPKPQTAEVVTEAAKPAPVYGVIMDAEELGKRHFRRGFETVLIDELKRGPGSAQMLVDRLLTSGEYQRVAPKAAENRPLKPVQELLTRWVGSKVLAIASEEEAAAVYAARAELANTAATAASIDEKAKDLSAVELDINEVNEVPAESEPAETTV